MPALARLCRSAAESAPVTSLAAAAYFATYGLRIVRVAPPDTAGFVAVALFAFAVAIAVDLYRSA